LCLFVLRTGGRGQSHKGNKRPPADVFSDGKQRPESQSEPSNDLQPIERERLKRLNQVRWTKLKDDTDELLKLATELKQEVDASNEQMLSVSVMRKAEQIEKLAKSVKEKMRGY
jgi:hypothetical protein